MRLAKVRGHCIHVTVNGIKTVCGALIADTTVLSRETDQWYLHTNCYNCAYRLWATEHRPAGYIRPLNSKDFPPRRECDHAADPRTCTSCREVRTRRA